MGVLILFLTCIAVAFLDHCHGHNYLSLVSGVVGRELVVPALFQRRPSFSYNYDGIIVFKILSPA